MTTFTNNTPATSITSELALTSAKSKRVPFDYNTFVRVVIPQYFNTWTIFMAGVEVTHDQAEFGCNANFFFEHHGCKFVLSIEERNDGYLCVIDELQYGHDMEATVLFPELGREFADWVDNITFFTYVALETRSKERSAREFDRVYNNLKFLDALIQEFAEAGDEDKANQLGDIWSDLSDYQDLRFNPEVA